jgi:hypothetical protein
MLKTNGEFLVTHLEVNHAAEDIFKGRQHQQQ